MLTNTKSFEKYDKYMTRNIQVLWEMIRWSHRRLVELGHEKDASELIDLIRAKLEEHDLLPPKMGV